MSRRWNGPPQAWPKNWSWWPRPIGHCDARAKAAKGANLRIKNGGNKGRRRYSSLLLFILFQVYLPWIIRGNKPHVTSMKKTFLSHLCKAVQGIRHFLTQFWKCLELPKGPLGLWSWQSRIALAQRSGGVQRLGFAAPSVGRLWSPSAGHHHGWRSTSAEDSCARWRLGTWKSTELQRSPKTGGACLYLFLAVSGKWECLFLWKFRRATGHHSQGPLRAPNPSKTWFWRPEKQVSWDENLKTLKNIGKDLNTSFSMGFSRIVPKLPREVTCGRFSADGGHFVTISRDHSAKVYRRCLVSR